MLATLLLRPPRAGVLVGTAIAPAWDGGCRTTPGPSEAIYRRYHLHQTRNPVFRHYWLAVHHLDRRCRKIIRRDGR